MPAVLDLPLSFGPPAVAAPRAILDHESAIKTWLTEHNDPPLRLKQIRRQILANRAESFEVMSDLPKSLRDALAKDWAVFGTSIDKHLVATDGTHKLLLRLHDGRLI